MFNKSFIDKESKMKKFITTFAMLILFAVGCSDQTNIISPEQSVQTQEPNWLVSLPSKGLSVNSIHSASEIIDGSKGGHVNLKEEIPGGPLGKIKIDSKLEVKDHSFTGTLTISTGIDDFNLLTTFGPHYTFDKPLEYTLELEGIDLTGVNPDSVDFVYQSEDGSIHQCQYKSISVDLNKGKVKVNKAKLPHFSRYGFVRRGN
jgi:hypothetical protein